MRDVLYSNVKVTVGNILSVGVVEIDDSYDKYNSVNNHSAGNYIGSTLP